MNYPTEKQESRIRMKPLSQDYLSLRSVSRQIQVEASRFLFKDKTLVLACDAGDAYRFLIKMPTDVLQHIKTLQFHELILLGRNGENRRNWPRLSKLIGKQMAVRQVILHVPNDPSFPNAFDDEDESDDSEDDSDDSDSNGAERRKVKRFRSLMDNWIGYWWPGAKLLIQLLIQGRIAHCIKLRYESMDYLNRCGIKDSAGLDKLKSIAELRYPYDSWLDERWLKGAAKRFRAIIEEGPIGDNAALTWYKPVNLSTNEKDLLDFDTGLGKDKYGHQLVVLTTKATQGSLWNGQKRP
jgi:hypothetical protein